MRFAPIVAVLVVLASTGVVAQTGPATRGTVVGNPTIDAVGTDARLTWGDDQQLTVTLSNDGTLLRGGPDRFESRVTTARSLRVDLATDRLDAPLSEGLRVRSGAALVGELGRGDATQVQFVVGVTDAVPPGTYELPLRLSYDYTALVQYGPGDPLYTERTVTQVLDVQVVVPEEPRLVVRPARNSSLAPGETGSYSFVVENTGSRTASNVGLTVTADPPVSLGRPDSGQTGVFVDRLAPGQTATLTIPAAVDADAPTATNLLGVTVGYTTPDGFERRNDRLRLGLAVTGNQTDAPAALAGS
jgi:hypothetical protein